MLLLLLLHDSARGAASRGRYVLGEGEAVRRTSDDGGPGIGQIVDARNKPRSFKDPDTVRHIITHHKSGTMMARTAVAALNARLHAAPLNGSDHSYNVTLTTDNLEPD